MRITFHGGLLLAALCAATQEVAPIEDALTSNELLALSEVDIEAELDKERDIYKEHDKEKKKRLAKEKREDKKERKKNPKGIMAGLGKMAEGVAKQSAKTQKRFEK